MILINQIINYMNTLLKFDNDKTLLIHHHLQIP